MSTLDPAVAIRSPRAGAWRLTLAAVVVVAAFVLIGVLEEAFAPAPQGPAESSYATTPAGVAAWAQLLSRFGYPVTQLRVPLAGATLDPRATLVALGAQEAIEPAGTNLARFVRAGGRLVIGGGDLSPILRGMLPAAPELAAPGPRVAAPAAVAPEALGVRTVRAAGTGAWVAPRGGRLPAGTVLAGRGGALLVSRTLGRGRIELLADPSVVENRLLGLADDALLSLRLGGPAGRPVVFAESLHGFGQASGLAAVPARWWAMFTVLALAASLWALAHARRVGPAENPASAPAPARSLYARSLARALARVGDGGELVALAREDLARAGGERPLGSSPAKDHDRELIALAAELARLESRGGAERPCAGRRA